MFRTFPLSIIGSFSLHTHTHTHTHTHIHTHTALVCHTGLLSDPARKLSANLYDIYHCCVYSEKLLMIDTGTVRNT